jgi:hypothetical protein
VPKVFQIRGIGNAELRCHDIHTFPCLHRGAAGPSTDGYMTIKALPGDACKGTMPVGAPLNFNLAPQPQRALRNRSVRRTQISNINLETGAVTI